MSRLVPHPLSTVLLLILWMMLNSFSLGHFLLGSVVALVAGWALGKIEPRALRVRRVWPLLKLAGIVFVDIIRSNIAVAWLILTRGRHGKRHSSFVEIPLTIKEPIQLAILSIIVTATPGTAWIEYDSDDNILLLHVFDMVDGDDWIALINGRYEALLLEAFE